MEAAVKKDAFRVCISALVARDPPLEFWTPLGLDSLQWAVRGLEPLPQLHRGLPHPPPPPAPHPLHLARRTRAACSASAGAAGRGGNRAGQAATSR